MSVRFEKSIVVGASSGIGAEITRQLAQAGGRVAVLARREPELLKLAGSFPGQVRAYVHDVTRPGEVAPLYERISLEMGSPDTLVYSAGVAPAVAEGEYDFTRDRGVIEVNLLGAMAWMDVAAAHFEAARGGTIIGISSVAGERGRRANPAYHTSKAALTTYLESLRNRCSRYGVNIVTIKPGFVDTAMIEGSKRNSRVVSVLTVSPEHAARRTLSIARKGGSPSRYVPGRWGLIAAAVRAVPSPVFRRLNF